MRGSGIPIGTISRGLVAATFLLLGAIASFSFGQAPAAPAPKEEKAPVSEVLAIDQKIIAAAKKDSEIMTNITYLSDIIGPRLTGSPALKKANDWTAEKMKSYGLTDVHLEAWTIPVGWERGTATARIIEPGNGRTLSLASAGWSPGTKGKVEGDVVIVSAKSAKDLEPYKGKLKNAIVLSTPPANVRPIGEAPAAQRERGQRTPPPADPKAADTKAGDAKAGDTKAGDGVQPPPERPAQPDFRGGMAFRRELNEFLRTEGVALILSDAGKPHGLLNTTGGWRGGDRANANEPVPTAFMAHEHYALLYRLASRAAPAKTKIEVEITNKMVPGPIAVYNTVGEIKGSEKPDEFVVVGAHLDSWDLGQGTTDNGTGTSVVLEAARILGKSGIKPKRTIRFVLFTGEEQGLYGSKEYVIKHKDELPKTSMALVHDTGTGKVTGIGLQGRAPLKPILDAEFVSLAGLGVKETNLRGMGGTDHLSFENAGVPGFAFQQDPSEYRLTHHSQSDTLDKASEPDLVQGAQVMAVAAMRVANMPTLLPREKK